jgi:WD40 repeat protein
MKEQSRDWGKFLLEAESMRLQEDEKGSSAVPFAKMILNGQNFSEVVRPCSRTVKVLVSAIPDEMSHELSVLEKEVFPFVSDLCRYLGWHAEFIIPPRQRFDFGRNSLDIPSCTVHTMRKCAEFSESTFFIGFIGGKHGEANVPTQISSELFGKVTRFLEVQGHDPKIIKELYKQDKNKCEEPLYLLQSDITELLFDLVKSEGVSEHAGASFSDPIDRLLLYSYSLVQGRKLLQLAFKSLLELPESQRLLNSASMTECMLAGEISKLWRPKDVGAILVHRDIGELKSHWKSKVADCYMNMAPSSLELQIDEYIKQQQFQQTMQGAHPFQHFQYSVPWYTHDAPAPPSLTRRGSNARRKSVLFQQFAQFAAVTFRSSGKGSEPSSPALLPTVDENETEHENSFERLQKAVNLSRRNSVVIDLPVAAKGSQLLEVPPHRGIFKRNSVMTLGSTEENDYERWQEDPSSLQWYSADSQQEAEGINPDECEAHEKYINNLANAVCSSLCRSTLEKYAASSYDRDPLLSQLVRDRYMIQQASSQLVGRSKYLQLIRHYLEADTTSPFVVYGEDGFGKTSVMAKAIVQASQKFNKKPKPIIVHRFLREKTHATTFMESILHQLQLVSGKPTAVTGPLSQIELIHAFRKTLASVGAIQNVFLFVDGMENISERDNGLSFQWLPRLLPPGVRMVLCINASCKTGLHALQKRIQGKRAFSLKVRGLKEDEQTQFIERILAKSKRTLSEAQLEVVQKLIGKTGNPLLLDYFSLTVTKWKSQSSLVQYSMSETVEGAFQDYLNELEHFFGVDPVSRVFSLLCVARHGWTTTEMLHLLSMDIDCIRSCEPQQGGFLDSIKDVVRFPHHNWLRLAYAMRWAIQEEYSSLGMRWVLRHAVFRRICLQRYILDETQMARIHRGICKFLSGSSVSGQMVNLFPSRGGPERFVFFGHPQQPLIYQFNVVEESQTTRLLRGSQINERKVRELPYHQVLSKEITTLRQTLHSVEFVQAKCAIGEIEDLLEDYLTAFETLGPLLTPIVVASERFVRRNLMHLRRDPSCALQMALLEHSSSPLFAEAVREVKTQVGMDRKFFVPIHIQQIDTRCMATFVGHGAETTCAAFSSDNGLLVSGCKDTKLYLWNTISRSQLASFAGHSHAVLDLVFTTDDAGIVSTDGVTIRYYDVETGDCLWNLTGKIEPYIHGLSLQREDGTILTGKPLDIRPLALSASGKYVASVPKLSRSIGIRDIVSRELIVTLEGCTSPISYATFSIDGKLMAAGTERGMVYVWELPKGTLLFSMRGHKGKVLFLIFSGDSEFLASTSMDRTARIWDVRGSSAPSDNKKHVKSTFNGGEDELELAATGISEGTNTQPELDPFVGMNAEDLSKEIDRLADTTNIPMLKKTVHHIFEYKALLDEDMREMEQSMGVLTVLPNGKQAASSGHLVEEPASSQSEPHGKAQRRIDTQHEGGIFCLSYSEDGQYLASGGADCKLHIWDSQLAMQAATEGHYKRIHRVAWAPNEGYDFRCLASGSFDATVKLWRLNEEDNASSTCGLREIKSLDYHKDIISGIAFQKREYVYVAGVDGAISKTDMKTMELTGLHPINQDGIVALAISPNHKWLAAGCSDMSLRILDPDTLTGHKRLVGPTASIVATCFDDPAQQLLSLSRNGELLVWDVRTWKQLISHKCTHDNGATGACFVADCIATVGSDAGLRLWSNHPAPETAVYASSPILCVATYPGSQRACFGMANGSIQVYESMLDIKAHKSLQLLSGSP